MENKTTIHETTVPELKAQPFLTLEGVFRGYVKNKDGNLCALINRGDRALLVRVHERGLRVGDEVIAKSTGITDEQGFPTRFNWWEIKRKENERKEVSVNQHHNGSLSELSRKLGKPISISKPCCETVIAGCFLGYVKTSTSLFGIIETINALKVFRTAPGAVEKGSFAVLKHDRTGEQYIPVERKHKETELDR